MRGRARRWLSAGVALIVVAGATAWFCRRPAGEPRLRPYVYSLPSVPIVFTSRSSLASFVAAAPEGEVFAYPGQALWRAEEGRLRLLTPQGTVHELTWDRPLPGGKLIDVMSPNVSPDGRTVVFAGRRGPPDAGHFRLYEIGVDGSGLRQLTGDSGDTGCTVVPPMRYRAADDQGLLADDERCRIDYDDVDPVSLGANGRVVFASSRIPDLGRGHARRATTLWIMNEDGGAKRPLTANRNNDRWPFLLYGGDLVFSLWSRNLEVISADERDIRPHEPGLASATRPTDSWLGAFRTVDGERLGALVKPAVPVWRPRPLFNGRIAFMTPRGGTVGGAAPGPLEVVQAEPGVLGSVPSARPLDAPLPRQKSDGLQRGPATDAHGRPMSFGTPCPCPGHAVLLAGAPCGSSDEIAPGSYGIYRVADDWHSASGVPVNPAQLDLQLLFDDPALADAEPVAVYPRRARGTERPTGHVARGAPEGKVSLADGTSYSGPGGQVFNSDLYVNLLKSLASQETDADEGPIFDGPPPGSIDHVNFYAARRDRFDDKVQPRVPGTWELLLTAPVRGSSLGAWLPAGVPTVLAAFGRDGRVIRYTTAARDRAGQRATFYGYAGDHYSGMPPGGQVFCIGCHPGHSGLARSDHDHAERLR